MSAQTLGTDLCLKPLYHNERHFNAPHYHTVSEFVVQMTGDILAAADVCQFSMDARLIQS